MRPLAPVEVLAWMLYIGLGILMLPYVWMESLNRWIDDHTT